MSLVRNVITIVGRGNWAVGGRLTLEEAVTLALRRYAATERLRLVKSITGKLKAKTLAIRKELKIPRKR